MTTIIDITEPESVRNSVTGLDPVLDGDHYDNQEWCTWCAGSDDPEDPGTPQFIVRERWDDWGGRGEAELSCGHLVALDDSVSSGRSTHRARQGCDPWAVSTVTNCGTFAL
jgi:hypothetical protein